MGYTSCTKSQKQVKRDALKFLKLLSIIGGKTAHYTSLAKIGQNRLKAKFFNQVYNYALRMLKSMKIVFCKTIKQSRLTR